MSSTLLLSAFDILQMQLLDFYYNLKFLLSVENYDVW